MNTTNLKRLQLEKFFLIYLNQENILKELEIMLLQYEKSVCNIVTKTHFMPPFRILLKLDLMKIQEISGSLYYLFVKEPEKSINLAKDVIYCAAQLGLSIDNLTKSDIEVIPLILNLPITNEISDLLRCPTRELESIQGVLISKTSVFKYIRSSVRRCELKFCPGSVWRRYPSGFGNVCPECYSSMEEDVTFSDMGEEVICEFLPLKAYRTQGRFQALTVKVRDELCSLVELRLGEEYKVIGRLNGNNFYALNIEVKQSATEFYNEMTHLHSVVLPESIAEIYLRISETSNCPWSFVFAISSQLGSHLLPISSFLHLKTGLLLSLSTQKNPDAAVPLFAIGDDSLNAALLFDVVGQYSERYVKLSMANSYLGGAAKPGFQSAAVLQEAGQLILGAKGICNLGDWSKLKREQANYICQSIESGQIVLNKGELGKKNLINFVPLKCAVWTYWSHATTKQSHQLQLKTLINIFGIPFLAQENNELEITKICLHNLKKSMKNSENTNYKTIPQADLKEFIEIINLKKPILSDEASQLIRNYFVVSRRERPQCLPLGAIKTITSLAEAHARIALRNEVLCEDIVAIIYLYEEAIATLFGESVNSYKKLTWDQKEPIYIFMGRQIRKFSFWLNEYISILNYSSNI